MDTTLTVDQQLFMINVIEELCEKIAKVKSEQDWEDMSGREIIFTCVHRGVLCTYIVESVRSREITIRELLKQKGPLGGDKFVRSERRHTWPSKNFDVTTLRLILEVVQGKH